MNAHEKNRLRESLRPRRQNLSPTDRSEKNRSILHQLENLPLFSKAHTILCYVSREEEVDTQQLLQTHLKNKQWVIPITKGEKLKLSRLHRWEDLVPKKFGILELEEIHQDPIEIQKIDLIIVPAIAFDRQGHRLGYGRGYYDQLLKETTAPTIGLAYSCQVVDRLPFEPHDVPVQHLLTENGLLSPTL